MALCDTAPSSQNNRQGFLLCAAVRVTDSDSEMDSEVDLEMDSEMDLEMAMDLETARGLESRTDRRMLGNTVDRSCNSFRTTRRRPAG